MKQNTHMTLGEMINVLTKLVSIADQGEDTPVGVSTMSDARKATKNGSPPSAVDIGGILMGSPRGTTGADVVLICFNNLKAKSDEEDEDDDRKSKPPRFSMN